MDAETLLLAASLIAERVGDDVKLRTDAMQSMLDDAVRESPMKYSESTNGTVKPSPFRDRVKSFLFRDSHWAEAKSLDVLTKASQHQIGVPFQGNSGRWFVRRQSDGRTVPAKGPNGESGGPSDKKPAAKKPAAGGGNPAVEKEPSTEKKPAPAPKQPKQAKPKETVSSVKSKIDSFVNAGKMDVDAARVLIDSIATLTVKEIGELKKQMGVKASGKKAEVAAKVADHVVGVAKKRSSQGKPAPAKIEASPVKKPAEGKKPSAGKVDPVKEVADLRSRVDEMVRTVDAIKAKYTGERWKEGSEAVGNKVSEYVREIENYFADLRKRVNGTQARQLARAYGMSRQFKTPEDAIRAVEQQVRSRIGWTVREFA